MCTTSTKSFIRWLKTRRVDSGNFNEGLDYSMARKRTHREKKHEFVSAVETFTSLSRR